MSSLSSSGVAVSVPVSASPSSSPIKRQSANRMTESSVSVCEAGEKPFCSCSWVGEDCPHGCPSFEEGYLDFMHPSVVDGFDRHLLSVAARRGVGCILQGSGDCWVRSPICCPDKRAVDDALIPKIRYLMSAM